MNVLRFPSFLFALLVVSSQVSGALDVTPSELRSLLKGNVGSKGTVVLFIGASCPVANKYIPRLNELRETWVKQGIAFVAFNSNAHESAVEVALHKKKFEISFDVYHDANHVVADLFQAEITPEAFLLSRSGDIVYRGRIDDQHRVGASTFEARSEDLKNAIEAVIAGEDVPVALTKAVGCTIARDYTNPVELTYAKDIAAIMNDKCLVCHRPNAVAEFFPWDDPETVVAMAEMIKEVVVTNRMPPWHADPAYGEFSNNRSLTEEQKEALVAWVDMGAPMGDEDAIPPAPEFPDGEWSIGTPDKVIELPEEVTVPADGVVNYMYFKVPGTHEEDLYVERVECLPGSAAVHHIILYFIPPGGDSDNRRMVGGSAPGDLASILPHGLAKRIPKGSTFLFEMHYTPIGREVTDRSKVGLVFSEHPDPVPVYTHPLGYQRFEIPAGDPNYREEVHFEVVQDITALSFMPHMHVRGKAFEYRVKWPDGTLETVLNVPDYDFNWQSVYRYREPLKIPVGSEIHCIAHWDNSEDNPYNPNPDKVVRFGEQTWDEMMFGFMDFHMTDPTIQGNPVRRLKNIRTVSSLN